VSSCAFFGHGITTDLKTRRCFAILANASSYGTICLGAERRKNTLCTTDWVGQNGTSSVRGRNINVLKNIDAHSVDTAKESFVYEVVRYADSVVIPENQN
jgi:hypothetical protein